jgi:hypothetical protein
VRWKRYRPVFSDAAVDFFATLSRRRQRTLLDRARELASAPLLVPDLRRVDEDGREIGDILIDDFLFSYWVDRAAKVVMIIAIEDTA